MRTAEVHVNSAGLLSSVSWRLECVELECVELNLERVNHRHGTSQLCSLAVPESTTRDAIWCLEVGTADVGILQLCSLAVESTAAQCNPELRVLRWEEMVR